MNGLEPVRAFFGAEAGRWSEQYAIGGSMADRPARFRDALSRLKLSGGRLLDLGCGAGDIVIGLSNTGWQGWGCDPTPAMIDMASKRPDGQNIHWDVLPAPPKLPYDDNYFDIVILSSVLEYVDDPQASLGEAARVLAPGGWCLATVPDMAHLLRRRERLKQVLAYSPLRHVLSLTRWASLYQYLRLSRNRPALPVWHQIFAAAGLCPVEGEASGQHPLALIAARKTG